MRLASIFTVLLSVSLFAQHTDQIELAKKDSRYSSFYFELNSSYILAKDILQKHSEKIIHTVGAVTAGVVASAVNHMAYTVSTFSLLAKMVRAGGYVAITAAVGTYVVSVLK